MAEEPSFFVECHSLVAEPLQVEITTASTAVSVLREVNALWATQYTSLFFDREKLSPDTLILTLTVPYRGPIVTMVDSDLCLQMLENPLVVKFLDSFVLLSRFRRIRYISAYRCHNRRWVRSDEIDPDPAVGVDVPDKLRVALYNVLFDFGGDETVKHSSVRHDFQLRALLPSQHADVFVLNEVTNSYVNRIQSIEFFRRDYWMVGHDSFSSFGSVVLSKIPIVSARLFHMRSLAKRPLLLVELSNGMVLVVCHLKATSTQPEYEFAIRKRQILEMSRFLLSSPTDGPQPHQTWFMLGDTNFDREVLPKYLSTEHNWIDMWPTLHNPESHPGYTYNPLTNPLIHRLWSLANTPYRFDRILLSSEGEFNVTEMKLFGNQRMRIRGRALPTYLFPSDHFGLLCVFEKKVEIEEEEAEGEGEEEDVVVDGFKKCFVKGFHRGMTDAEIREMFLQFGEIVSISISPNSSHAFIEFASHSSAVRSCEALNGRNFGGRPFVCVEAVERQKDSNLYVKNFPLEWPDETLRQQFLRFGPIASSKIMRTETGKSRGFGFVGFERADDAARAMEEMADEVFECADGRRSRPLYVSFAQSKAERRRKLAQSGSSDSVDPMFFDVAADLGRRCAEAGREVRYGGGRRGMMGSLARAVKMHGGRLVGVIPEFMIELGWAFNDEEDPNLRCDELIATKTMHERKKTFLDGDVEMIVALAGGIGTLEELLEMMTWRQLGILDATFGLPLLLYLIFHARVVVINTDGFYDSLRDLFRGMLDRGFLSKGHSLGLDSVVTFVASPEEAVALLEEEDDEEEES